MKNNLQIAIDGPVASGKGTLAVALAKRLDAIHVYSGGMYRSLALACFRRGIDIHNPDQVLNLLKGLEIVMRTGENSQTHILLNGEDVTNEIFYPEISNITPIVSAYREVREVMVEKQKALALGKRVIMEGRDITTVVLPDADLKIFLTADIDIRTQRRLSQLSEKGSDITFDTVKKDIAERDARDSQREVSPLQESEDAFIVDTSHDTIDETVEKVILELNRRNLI